MTTRLVFTCGALALAPMLFSGGADAQVIRVKTLPVAESEQFSFLPSAGIAGVTIALADTLRDPFVNPAKGARLRSSQYFGAPTFFSVTSSSGTGTTFPLGAMWKRGSSFASLAAAVQSINRRDDRETFFSPQSSLPIDASFAPPPPSQPSTTRNGYSIASFGHTLDSARLSFGVSALWSGLGAVEGVDQFYIATDWLRQKGHAMDVRFGVLKEWQGGSSLEAVIVRNRFDHAHDAGFTDQFWDPAQRRTFGRPRTEHKGELTDTWGLQMEYERPVLDSSWRVGLTMTGNRIWHGRIPTFEVFEGLGSTGQSTAFNAGVGIARLFKPFVVGADFIYEPITSSTRVADSLSNRFRFSNARVRAGVSRSFELADPGSTFSFQLGAEWYGNSYVMNQRDHVSDVTRIRRESWLEVTRTAGMSFRVPGVEVHYLVRTRSGVHRPGVVDRSGPILVADVIDAPWMLPTPNAAVLGPVRVAWHQFAISIPHR